MKIGEITQEYRKAHRLSIADFSRLCRVSDCFISQLESEKYQYQIKAVTLRKLAIGMNMTEGELLEKIKKTEPCKGDKKQSTRASEDKQVIISNSELTSYMYVMFLLAMLTSILQIIVCLKIFNLL